MIRADFHIHTCYSSDATTHPRTIADQLQAHPFIKAAAITDHNTLSGYFKVRELASPYPDVLIIPGIEVGAIGGDVIILGVEEEPRRPWSVADLIDFADERNGVVIAAHPYREPGLGDTAREYDLDAIEVLNGISEPSANREAEELAKTMGLPGVAGSDAHQEGQLWSAYTELQASLSVDAVVQAVKRGRVQVGLSRESIHF